MAGKYVWPLLNANRLARWGNGAGVRIAPNFTTGSSSHEVLRDMIFGAAGAPTPPAITGTSAFSQEVQTLSATGTNVQNVSGTSVLTQSVQTLSATGTIISPISGTGALSQSVQTFSAAGSNIQNVSGTGALSQAAQTLTASGSNIQVIDGSGALVQVPQTFSASGENIQNVSGEAVFIQAEQDFQATGDVSGAGVTGSASLSQTAQMLSASGVVVAPAVFVIGAWRGPVDRLPRTQHRKLYIRGVKTYERIRRR